MRVSFVAVTLWIIIFPSIETSSIAMPLFSLLVMAISGIFLLLPKLVMAISEAVRFFVLT